MQIVLDTNVIVSAVLTPAGRPAWLLSQVIAGRLQLCYDFRIAEEYREVLLRPKFNLQPDFVEFLLHQILTDGIDVVAPPLAHDFIDESDKKFFEVAKYCQAPLVTGNLKHFPEDPLIRSVADFCNSVMPA